MTIPTKEYTDGHTGVRLTVEYDIPEWPRMMIHLPPDTWQRFEIEEVNEAIKRLMTSARAEEKDNPHE